MRKLHWFLRITLVHWLCGIQTIPCHQNVLTSALYKLFLLIATPIVTQVRTGVFSYVHNLNANTKVILAIFPCPKQIVLGTTGHSRHRSISYVRHSADTVANDRPTASTSQTTLSVTSTQSESDSTLTLGLRINTYDAQGLLEICSVCNRMFIPNMLREHIAQGCGGQWRRDSWSLYERDKF